MDVKVHLFRKDFTRHKGKTLQEATVKIKTRVVTNINIAIFRFIHKSFSSKKKKKKEKRKIKRQKLQNYIGKDKLIS